jgi:L-aspartate oxidase
MAPESTEQRSCDYLVIGTGLAGLSFALRMADQSKVIVLSKSQLEKTNTDMAQGGIASVSTTEDSFEEHIADTLNAGAGLCREEIVKMCVEQGPDRIRDLQDWGVVFDRDLTREGGHHKRRIFHIQDHTGHVVHSQLLKKCKEHKNIEMVSDMMAVDLISDKKVEPDKVGPARCIGVYALDTVTKKVVTFLARATVLATGGAGKIYLYTSNWSGATGDGIAMAYRMGARIANLEFMQFHPTCLYHPEANNFLITEAIRGEGGILKNKKGEAFMKRYHPLESLAPRDIVARSIDAEIKKSGDPCVYLDISHRPREFILDHFPMIYERCKAFGIDITTEAIPVVPAAHYLCGGILVDRHGRTDVPGLMAIGETICSGLHGANRLASNSLLECLVFSYTAAEYIKAHPLDFEATTLNPPDWIYHGNHNEDEMIMISHMWDEIRRLMWNYVGIVRTNRRLERAENRLVNIQNEIQEYYWNFRVHPDILELRNLAQVAQLTVQCALKRKDSIGIHYNLDHPPRQSDQSFKSQDTVIGLGIGFGI